MTNVSYVTRLLLLIGWGMASMGHFGCLVPPVTQAGFISFAPNPAKKVYGSATGGGQDDEYGIELIADASESAFRPSSHPASLNTA